MSFLFLFELMLYELEVGATKGSKKEKLRPPNPHLEATNTSLRSLFPVLLFSMKNGLQSVIRDLRSASTDDPEIIADEFSKYRREFLRDVVKDVSKVLNIPGY